MAPSGNARIDLGAGLVAARPVFGFARVPPVPPVTTLSVSSSANRKVGNAFEHVAQVAFSGRLYRPARPSHPNNAQILEPQIPARGDETRPQTSQLPARGRSGPLFGQKRVCVQSAPRRGPLGAAMVMSRSISCNTFA